MRQVIQRADTDNATADHYRARMGFHGFGFPTPIFQ
jgi:hypothetical protein